MRGTEGKPPWGMNGFTLLEILVALTLMGTTVIVILQLYTSNLKTIARSEGYVPAILQADFKMREILDSDRLEEKTWREIINDKYDMEVAITEILKSRVENLQVTMMEIQMKLHWQAGPKKRTIILRTTKLQERINPPFVNPPQAIPASSS